MALSALALSKAKPREKPYKLADGHGLYLLVTPQGGRYWRMNYRFDGKAKTMAMGVFPLITLAEAREKREDARKLLAAGSDQGLGTASLFVPAGNSSSPFANDILLHRYLDEVPALTQNGSIWTLHAGLGLIGGFSGWNWSLRLNHDRKRSQTDSDLGFDMANVQDAILLGGDAFSPFSAGQIGTAIRNRARSIITTNDAQFILNGQVLTLPAGPVTVTTTFNAQRSNSDSRSRAFPDANVVLGRSQGGSSLAATIPIASAADNVLPFLGRLSVDLSGGVNAVSRYGPLYTAHASLVWAPVKHVQLLATLKRAETAPTLDQLGAPRIATPNMPFVDLVSGESGWTGRPLGGPSSDSATSVSGRWTTGSYFRQRPIGSPERGQAAIAHRSTAT